MTIIQKGEPMSDLIDRQAAIDALGEKPLVWDDLSDFDLGKAAQWSDDVDAIKELPSAQPEIIRCNVCRHWHQTTGEMKGFGLGDCDYLEKKLVTYNGYCYWAGRKEDE